MTEKAKSNVIPVIFGAALAVVLGLAFFLLMPKADMPLDAAPNVSASVAPTAVAEAEVPEAAPDIVAEAPEALVAPTAPLAPAFDTFRVELDGSMVIAGRAEPGQVVDIMLAGVAIDRVTADAGGSFVALPMAGPSDVPRRLSLLADPEGQAIGSETSYLVAPIAPPVAVAEAVPEQAPEVDAPQAVETAAAEVLTQTPPVIPAPDVAVAPVAPPTVLQADADGIRVVQGGGPSFDAPDAQANVVLDAITYDPEGEVQLSGRATGDGSVNIYLDNEPLITSPVTQGGDWRIDLPQVDTGVYTLRIDEVDTEGDVVSRVETPFRREEPRAVAAVLAEQTSREGFEVAVRTVQPGATLWAIAEENLGNGIFYIEVFEANSDLIRDPDLIYPGQIFRIPERNQ